MIPGDLVVVRLRGIEVFTDDGYGSFSTLDQAMSGDVGLIVCLSSTAWPGCLIAWGSGLLGWSAQREVEVLG